MILNAILNLIWVVLIQGPLQLIGAFNKVLEYLTGGIINDILFGSKKEFQWSKVPAQFFWFVLVSFCIFALIFVIQMIILIFQEAAENKTKFVLAIQNGCRAFAFMFLIPIFFFLANFIVQNLSASIKSGFTTDSNIADYLYHIGNTKWKGNSMDVPPDYSAPSNIRQYNILAQVFGAWFMLGTILFVGIILVQKVIELFFLFIISPIVMIVMIIDNGKAAFTWKDMVIAKFLASSATLVGYYIFISAAQFLLVSNMPGLQINPLSKTLFLLLFLCAGGLATIGFSNIIASLIGEAVGISEAKSSFQSTMRGGLLALAGASKVKKGISMLTNSKMADSGSSMFSDVANGLSITNSDSDKKAMKKSGLNFNPFNNITSAMSSRTGIIGLAGTNLERFGNSLGNLTAKTMKSFQSNKNDKSTNQIKGNKKEQPNISFFSRQKNIDKNQKEKSLGSNQRTTSNNVYRMVLKTGANSNKAVVKKSTSSHFPKQTYLSKLNKKVGKHQSKSVKKYQKQNIKYLKGENK